MKLSIVLPVYNRADHIQEAVDSLLRQTFADFELIIIDDRSTDRTPEIIRQYTDARIRFYVNEQNLGRAGSDNRAASLIRGQYVAKMDSDDVCHPQRFEKQVAFLDQHPEVNVVGSWMQNFGASTYLNKYPETVGEARAFTLFGLPVGNPSVMMRAELLTQQGLHYDGALRQTEDFDFFARYIRELNTVTLPEALIQYRVYPDDHKKEILTERHEVSDRVREQLLNSWGIAPSARELAVHNALAVSDLNRDNISLQECAAWLDRLLRFNESQPIFDQKALRSVAADKWFYACYFCTQGGFKGWTSYRRHALARVKPLTPGLRMRFLAKNLRHMLG